MSASAGHAVEVGDGVGNCEDDCCVRPADVMVVIVEPIYICRETTAIRTLCCNPIVADKDGGVGIPRDVLANSQTALFCKASLDPLEFTDSMILQSITDPLQWVK